ncbi:hypothetical protein KVV02_007393 [Mortierella alpina]|uniref:C2H2-type domain-containing protein n=1 Tax=Mortierella alpina TaxID=64518 RepID=A0A9P8A885_MORAP|nr:hypothetical protein KVV02_007393 [Mortierella alpina]
MASAVPSLSNEAHYYEYTAFDRHSSAHSPLDDPAAHSALMPPHEALSDDPWRNAAKFATAGQGSEGISTLWSGSVTGRLTKPEHDQESIISLSDAHPSPSSSVFTPASTPCSESDDSALIDSLSPPLSPWFPSVAQIANDQSMPGKDDPRTINTSELFTSPSGVDLDFFNNSFYQSLRNHSSRQRKTSVAYAVRDSVRGRTKPDNHGTAAPSDLFSVTIDQILSADPLDFELLDNAISKTSKIAYSEATDIEQEVDTQSSFDSDETLYAFQNKASSEADSISTQEPEMDDQNDSDYTEPSSKRQRASAAGITPQDNPVRRRSGKGKAPRVKKAPIKKTPKVYPQRRTKNHIQGDDNKDGRVSQLSLGSLSLSSAPSPSWDFDSKGPMVVVEAGDGGYLCKHCPQERFGRVHDLKRHQISKHNERTWPCDFCHRPFVRRDALLRHYTVKAARNDGIHPSSQETCRLSEARARAKLI